MAALVAAIDQGTSSSRFIVFTTEGEVVTQHQLEHKQIYPEAGWVEHDPMEILDRVEQCASVAVAELGSKGYSRDQIKSIGITNQRETTVVWDKMTGKPLHNAIVWLDTRSATTCNVLSNDGQNKDRFRAQCGLPLSTYFSGTKLRWLIDNVPAVQAAIKDKTCLFGTIDTWLLWNLTGGPRGGVHVTDVTNASRTMLMDIKTLQWDQSLCDAFGVPMEILPTIRSSAEVYGKVSDGALLGIPLSACLGDQQSACVGQALDQQGSAKNTYGTGCFLLLNTGGEPVTSSNGLLTTVCYQLGADAQPVYALEGSVAVAGAAVQWIRDNFGLISNSSEIESLARSVPDTAGLYFVPAFSGLYAPRWRNDARGVAVGFTLQSTKAHLCRAVLESVCFQTYEVLEAMNKDSGVKIARLQVDGGMTANNLVMQTQADIINAPVVRPSMAETTALGAAMASGLAVGVFASAADMFAACKQKSQGTVFESSIGAAERQGRLARWNDAVERTLNLA